MKTLYIFLLTIFISNSYFYAQTPGAVSDIMIIESTIPFQGYEENSAFVGRGEYQIFYDNVDGVLDRPLLISDGFDPNDSNDIGEIYNVFTYSDPSVNLLDVLRNHGIDIVIVSYPNYTRPTDGEEIQGGADYIERNGYVFSSLIDEIKSLRVGNQELISLGISMGGLITRYALTYMEQNGLEHETGLWVSFDAPHKGANIPISLQYLLNYLAVNTNDEQMDILRDSELNSPAAKQMLLDHYSSHLAEGSEYLQDTGIQLPTPAAVFNTNFYTLMDAMGYPTQTRNIALVNGSILGTMTESPGATIIDANLTIEEPFSIDIMLQFTPEANISNYNVDHIQPWIGSVPGAEYDAVAASPSFSAGLDSAPGGTVLFDNFFGENPEGIMAEFQEALMIDAFDFIPTLSAMAIDEQNWYNSVDGTEITPFEAYIAPSENEQHITTTNVNMAFLRDEVFAFLDIVSGTSEEKISEFRLVSNPVQEVITLALDNNYISKNLIISILNISGQQVATYKYSSAQGELNVPSPSVDGYYLLSIADENCRILEKFIVQK